MGGVTHVIPPPVTISTLVSFSTFFHAHQDVSVTDVSPNEVLGRSVPWTMRPLHDSSSCRLFLWTMRPLDDSILGRCVPDRCVPTPSCTYSGIALRTNKNYTYASRMLSRLDLMRCSRVWMKSIA